MKWCTRCLMPDTRPRIVFTGDVCNACLWAEERKAIDYKERHREFKEVVAAHKRHPVYDCIVPFSGGKDSATIAWRLKYEEGLNPLLVCYGQLIWTDVGRRNFRRVQQAGLNCFYWACDQRVSAALARRFFIERGHIKQHYDAAVNSVPIITAVNFGIPLVFFAEHGETEYGGLVLSEEHRRTRDLAEVLENQVGDDARNWVSDEVSEKDLYPYIYPALEDIERVGVKAFYYSYFFDWDIYENAKFTREKMGFEQANNGCLWHQDLFLPRTGGSVSWWGKSDGSFEGFDSIDDKCDDVYLWMMYRKFGFGRASRMASRLIQRRHISRTRALGLAKRYDGEYPASYLPDVLDYLGMTEEELNEIADSHTNTALFEKRDGWQLKYPPK